MRGTRGAIKCRHLLILLPFPRFESLYLFFSKRRSVYLFFFQSPKKFPCAAAFEEKPKF